MCAVIADEDIFVLNILQHKQLEEEAGREGGREGGRRYIGG